MALVMLPLAVDLARRLAALPPTTGSGLGAILNGLGRILELRLTPGFETTVDMSGRTEEEAPLDKKVVPRTVAVFGGTPADKKVLVGGLFKLERGFMM